MSRLSNSLRLTGLRGTVLVSIVTGIVTVSLGKADLAEGVPITGHKEPPEDGDRVVFSAQESPLEKKLDKSALRCYY